MRGLVINSSYKYDLKCLLRNIWCLLIFSIILGIIEDM